MPTAQPNQGEAAVADLLYLFSQARYHTYQYSQQRSFTQGTTARSPTPNFLSAGIPRDRRGRIGDTRNMGTAILNAGGRTAVDPHGSGEFPEVNSMSDELDTEGVETPRIGGMERDKDIPLALRPMIEHHRRASTGGWGLGAGKEEKQGEDDDDDDETMDWDQAQVRS